MMTHSNLLAELPIELLELLMSQLRFKDCLSMLLTSKTLSSYLQQENLPILFYLKYGEHRLLENTVNSKNNVKSSSEKKLAEYNVAIETLEKENLFNLTTCKVLANSAQSALHLAKLITILNGFGLATEKNCSLFIAYPQSNRFLNRIQSITQENKKLVEILLISVELGIFPSLLDYEEKNLIELNDAGILTARHWDFVKTYLLTEHKSKVVTIFIELNQQHLLDIFHKVYLDERDPNQFGFRIKDVENCAQVLLELKNLNFLNDDIIEKLLSIKTKRYACFDSIWLLKNNKILIKTTLAILLEQENSAAFKENFYDVAKYLVKLNQCGWFQKVNNEDLAIELGQRILVLLEELIQFNHFNSDFFIQTVSKQDAISEAILSSLEQLKKNKLLTKYIYELLINMIHNKDNQIGSITQIAIQHPDLFRIIKNNPHKGAIAHGILKLKESGMWPINDDIEWILNMRQGQHAVETADALILLWNANLFNKKVIRFIYDMPQKAENIAWAIIQLTNEKLLDKLQRTDIALLSDLKCKESTFAIKLICFLFKQILHLNDTKKHYSAYLMKTEKIEEKINEYQKTIMEVTRATTEQEIINMAAKLPYDKKLTQSCNLWGFSFFDSPSTRELKQYVETQVKLRT